MNDAELSLINSYINIINKLIDLFSDNGIEFDDILNAVSLDDSEKELLEEIIEND